MQKSLLDVYLGKVAAGDDAFIDKLCSQLTDRLCYIPAIQVSSEFNQAKVEVIKISKERRSFVPLFTHERKFKSWSQSIEKKVEPLSLLGGDLCAVLGDDTGVLIDPGAENSVELSPEVVAKIALQVLAIEPEQDYAEDFEDEQIPQRAPARNDTADFGVGQDLGFGAVAVASSASADGVADDFDPFAGRPPGIDRSIAPSATEEDFNFQQPTKLEAAPAPSGVDVYDSLIEEMGSAKTRVAPAHLVKSTSLTENSSPAPKKTSFLGFIKKVVGKK